MSGRAVIFDLDGTLVDSLADIAQAMNACLAERGHPTHPVAAYRDFVGEGIEVLVRRAMPRGADEGELLMAMRSQYARNLMNETRLYPGIGDVLAELHRRDVPMAVLSNKPHDLTRRVVAMLVAPRTFVQVLGHRPDRPRKPDPTTARVLADALGRPAEQCLFVGDTPIDIATAHGANMIAVGVSWGFRPAERLRECGAAHILERPAALLDLV